MSSTAQLTAVQNQPMAEVIDFNELIEVDGHDVFPEMFQEKGISKLKMRKHRSNQCLPSNENYIPDEETFKKVLMWWMAPVQLVSLGLFGETGTGKTELLMYLADRLNEPVYLEKITTGMRSEHIEGGYELQTDNSSNSVTLKRYSQAAKGYINGGLVILDEIDKAGDDLSTALHLFLEGKPWTINAFGETHQRHPLCRIAGTSNTTGGGGHEIYTTSRKLDGALRNRFGWIKTHYPDLVREMAILESNFPRLPYMLRHLMVDTANKMRDALLGPDRKGIDGSITCPFSTRNIVNWGYYIMVYGLERSPMESLEFSFMGAVDQEDLPDVEAILQRVWGEKINQPLAKFIEEEANPKS
jgi:cobaltochelatase CobS